MAINANELEKNNEIQEKEEKSFYAKDLNNKPRKIDNPIWLSVSEAAKLGGVQNKTIRRAIQSNTVKFRIISNRYQVDLESLIRYLHSNKKLNNKLLQKGIGQYVDKYNLENLNE